MNNEFKIVKIIDEYKVVVNAGCDYLEEDDILEVFKIGEKVFDPETKDLLGTLDIVKARLKIHTLYEKMCLCVNEKSKNPISAIPGSALSAFQSTPIALQVDLKQVSGGFDASDMTIKVGDLVRKAL